MEETSKKAIFVYIKGGIFPWSIEDFQQKIGEIYEDYEDLGTVSRPIYGMKIIGHLIHGIGKFVQVLPVPVERLYYGFQLDESSRIFVEEAGDGISIIMESLHDFELENIQLTKTREKLTAQERLLHERWKRFEELVSL
jgi:hypothetical protein